MNNNCKQYLTPDTSLTIDFLRVILIIFVIFMHYPLFLGTCTSSDLSTLDYSFSNLSTIAFDYIQVLLNKVLSANAVPLFYVFSGYLFFLKYSSNVDCYLNKLKKRTFSLMIPYILWNIATLIFFCAIFLIINHELNFPEYFIQQGGISFLWDSNVWGENDVNWLGWHTPWSGPIDIPLWYVRNLIVMVLLSPVVFFILKYSGIFGLILLASGFMSGIFINVPGLNSTSFFFFSFGAYFAINNHDLIQGIQAKKQAKKLMAILCFISICVLMYCIVSGDSVIYRYTRPFYILFYSISTLYMGRMFVIRYRKTSSYIASFSNSVFFIYASHILIIVLIKSLHIPQLNSDWLNLLIYLLGGFSVYGIGLLTFILMRNYTPVLLKPLNGFRL